MGCLPADEVSEDTADNHNESYREGDSDEGPAVESQLVDTSFVLEFVLGRHFCSPKFSAAYAEADSMCGMMPGLGSRGACLPFETLYEGR